MRLLNEKRIAFIIAVRDRDRLDLCLNSIAALKVPAGYTVDVMAVENRQGKAAAYRAGMQESEAKYKIYLDESACILADNVLAELLAVFAADENIGAVGVLGTEQLPVSGIFSQAKEFFGSLYLVEEDRIKYGGSFDGRYREVMAVDGCFFATCGDVNWRADLFKDDCFVISAACAELCRAQRRVVVAQQDMPWVMKGSREARPDEGSRKAFLAEYAAEVLPLVAILLPTYNRPALFKQALESVLAQTYRNLEIVVSDASEGQETEKLIQPYLRRDKRIKYIHQTDVGGNWPYLSHYATKAEYVNWLMDDDLFLPEKIEKMMDAFLREDGLSMVTSFRQVIDIEGKVQPVTLINQPIVAKTTRLKGDTAGRLLLQNWINHYGEPTTVLMKKSYFCDRCWLGWNENNFQHAMIDVTTWLNLLSKGDMVYITEPLSCFRRHGGQDQQNISTILKTAADKAELLSYAWNHRIFLHDDKAYRESAVQFIMRACMALTAAENDNLDDYRVQLLRRIVRDVAESLVNGYKFEFAMPEDFKWS